MHIYLLKSKIYDILHPPPLEGGPLCHDLSIPSFHLGHAVGALNHIQPSLLFGNLC